MKRLARKLTLNRETLRLLNPDETSQVAGGYVRVTATATTNQPFCQSDALSCPDIC